MKKEAYIRKYGIAEWEARLAKSQRTRVNNRINKAHEIQDELQKLDPSEQQEILREMWKSDNGNKLRSRLPENIIVDRNKIRQAHNAKWGRSKNLDCHHEWIGDTAEYTGAALVEREAHRHGRINVVVILKGAITEFERR